MNTKKIATKWKERAKRDRENRVCIQKIQQDILKKLEENDLMKEKLKQLQNLQTELEEHFGLVGYGYMFWDYTDKVWDGNTTDYLVWEDNGEFYSGDIRIGKEKDGLTAYVVDYNSGYESIMVFDNNLKEEGLEE